MDLAELSDQIHMVTDSTIVSVEMQARCEQDDVSQDSIIQLPSLDEHHRIIPTNINDSGNIISNLLIIIIMLIMMVGMKMEWVEYWMMRMIEI